MPNGETYAHIDSEIGNGQRIKVKPDGKWEFVEEDKGSFNAWVQKNGNQFIFGVITSIIAGLLLYYLLKKRTY